MSLSVSKITYMIKEIYKPEGYELKSLVTEDNQLNKNQQEQEEHYQTLSLSKLPELITKDIYKSINNID